VVITNRVVWVTVAIGVVVAAGLFDDLTHGGPRGLRGHVRALLDRRLTTGMAKVAAAFAGGVIVVVLIPNRSALERALGVGVGAGVYTVLSVWGLAGATVLVVGLNAVAETVTLSRVVDAVPPLRWFDRVGRRKSVRKD